MFDIDSPMVQGASLITELAGGYFPAVVSSPEEELLACRKTAWLGVSLNLSPVYDITGPDAAKLLNHVCVNRDFSALKIGGSRHAILCNGKGQMLADGVLLRKAEDTFRTYWLAPVLAYYVETLGMDVKGQWVRDEFFIQIDGPRSLEVMEKAAHEDLHAMKFAQNMQITIAGCDVTIHRLGMSGCLAYEMHGNMAEIETVLTAICEAGEEFGVKRLGHFQYPRNHTQGGYPNQFIHYWYPYFSSDDAMTEYMKKTPYLFGQRMYCFAGSAGSDPENAFMTPYDVGWGYLVNFDHDFIGKEALAKLEKNPPRTVVTLEWDPQDVGRIFATQFMGTDVEPCDDLANEISLNTVRGGFPVSKVLAGDTMIGVSTGRTKDYYHRKMISLGFIDRQYAQVGDKLTLVWGSTPGTEMKVTVTVAEFPYYNEEYRNETFDVEKIPHPTF